MVNIVYYFTYDIMTKTKGYYMDKKIKVIGITSLVIVLSMLLFGGNDITPEGEKALKVLDNRYEFMNKYLDEQHEKCLQTSKKDFCNKRTDYAKDEVEKNYKKQRADVFVTFKK